jgi:hypothetical protein
MGRATWWFECEEAPRNTRTLFSFFLCRLKLRYAFLQNSNSVLEVIYCTARRVKLLLTFGRIFRNQFLEKVYVALQATCSSHHVFFRRADFHTRNILCACGAGTERYADGKNQRLPDHNPVPERPCEAATPQEAARLGRLRPASAITRLVNWGDFSASVESQERALAEIQKALPDHQLHGYLGCSAGTLSCRDTQSARNLAATVRPTIGPLRHFKISPLARPQRTLS